MCPSSCTNASTRDVAYQYVLHRREQRSQVASLAAEMEVSVHALQTLHTHTQCRPICRRQQSPEHTYTSTHHHRIHTPITLSLSLSFSCAVCACIHALTQHTINRHTAHAHRQQRYARQPHATARPSLRQRPLHTHQHHHASTHAHTHTLPDLLSSQALSLAYCSQA
jgi:hypothetical protein